MPNLDHTPSATPAEPARPVSRGLIVGDYEGLRAGEAIVAIRTLGLRPSLERVEGYEDSLHGFVVSQDPSPGTELPADSQLFIYIAAPPRAVVAREPETLEEPEAEDLESVDAEEPPELEDSPGEEDSAWVEEEPAAATAPASVEEEPADPGWVEEEPSEPATDTEWGEDEPAEPGEPAEPVRVWRGPAPGAVPRRRIAPRRGRRVRDDSPHRDATRSRLGSLPLGVQLATVALFVCLALTLILSLASRVQSPSRPPSTVAISTTPAPAAPRVPSRVPAPPRSNPRPPRQRSASHRTVRSRRAVRSPRPVTVAPAPSPPSYAPSPAAPLTGAAAAEHAAREFGP